MLRITRVIPVVAAGLGLGLAGFGIAYASIPDSGGVIHACYQSPPPAHGANLQIIDTGNGGSCSGGAMALTWNQTGPQGPPGLAGVHVVTSPSRADGNPYETDCPSGETALSVVFNQVNSGVFDQAISATPVLNGSGLPVGYQYQSDNTLVYKANVTCATTS